MKIVNTNLSGVMLVEPSHFEDQRGSFVKTFHREDFKAAGVSCNFAESFYTSSRKNVIRGLHFQAPPGECAKLVHVIQGSILDLVLDIRAGSETYGKYMVQELSAANRLALFIPTGFAHGFLAKENDSIVSYLQTSIHLPDCDLGILATSLEFDWGIASPIISNRDLSFPSLSEFETPFSLQGTQGTS